MVAADRAWNAITPSLRSVLFGLYYIQYCLLVYTSFLASAHLQLKHFPLLFFWNAPFQYCGKIRVIISGDEATLLIICGSAMLLLTMLTTFFLTILREFLVCI